MLDLALFYWLLAAFLLYAGWRNARERRWLHAGFWGVLALLFAGGDWILAARKAGDALPAQLAGIGVIALALLAVRHAPRTHRGSTTGTATASAHSACGHWLFVPALLIPLVTVLVVFFGAKIAISAIRCSANGSTTLIGLALASVIAALAAIVVTRQPAIAAPAEGRRLLDTMGWAALLPLVLATLGGVFAASGVGDAIAALVSAVIPDRQPPRLRARLRPGHGAVHRDHGQRVRRVSRCMTAGIGLPLLIQRHGADPAILGVTRHAHRLLRHAADADGGQLQPGARGAAGTRRPQRE